MWDAFIQISKVKNPIVVLLSGMALGFTGAWLLSSYIHNERINTLTESRDEFRRNAEEQEKLNTNQQSEIAAYKQKLDAAETANAAMRSRSGTDWQKMLANIDKDIEKKRRQIVREKAYYASPLVPNVGVHGKNIPKPEKSYQEASFEKELQDLIDLKALIRRQQIEAQTK